MAQDSTQTDFYVGICMAGAVSAGAYTAGVIDRLIEVMNEWEERKKNNIADTPRHNVIFPVLGGASAGGMTAIITAAALYNKFAPVTKLNPNLLDECPDNPLYHSWVDLSGNDVFAQMLDNSDINKDGLMSLMNSSFIDSVAQRAVAVKAKPWDGLPTYIDPKLKVFTTLTNLRGICYDAGFKGGLTPNKYYMSVHNDYACFELKEKNSAALQMNNGQQEAAQPDTGPNYNFGWMPLDFDDESSVAIARNAAMATGAFPVGLRSRVLDRGSGYVNANVWNSSITSSFPVAGPSYLSLNVDGGVINNEPYEKVRDVLNAMSKNTSANKSERQKINDHYDSFTSTVLMIDPFPSAAPPDKYEPKTKLSEVVASTLGAMFSQMRAKHLQIEEALDPGNAGQFLIAPSRQIHTNEKSLDAVGDRAIACGAMNGFSGFLSKEFRVHDFFLGRYNCDIFLRKYFTVPAGVVLDHPVFGPGYRDVDLKKFTAPDGSVQIIPVFSDAPTEFPIPQFSNGTNWPTMSEEAVDAYSSLIKKRVNTILLKTVNVTGINRLLLWIGSKVLINRKITDAVLAAVKKSLRDQLLLETLKK
jgi:predicted acylesterase/phospholipase RssA